MISGTQPLRSAASGSHRSKRIPLEFTARIDINHTWSASQYESAIEQLFEDKNLSPSDFRGVIISSVVPSVLTLLQECVRNLFGTEPLLVTSESDLGMTFSIPEPEK